MKLIFERGAEGRGCSILPPCDVPEVEFSRKRETKLCLPSLSETEINRHYSELEKQVYGVNSGFYPWDPAP